MSSKPKFDPGRDLTERFVKADGRRFRTIQAGSGVPLVVFESGLGSCGSMWAEVQRQVAVHTATMAYDRAGLLGSDKAKDCRLLIDLNRDLEAILDALGHEGPILLVGQSWGGPTVRSMAHFTRRPLAGVVLVDGTNSHVMPKEIGKTLAAAFGLFGKLSWLGLHRKLRASMTDAGVTAGLAKDDSDRVHKDVMRARTTRASAAEAAGLLAETEADGLATLEAKGFPEGVPVVFLTAGLSAPKQPQEMVDGFIATQTAEAERLGARQILVSTSRHDIHMQEPALVADEIIALVKAFSA